jgi:hypothetical protein
MPIALRGFSQKTSKENSLSLYLSTRNIQQHGDSFDQQLEVVIHKSKAFASADLRVSLVGRLVIDAGLQFIEKTIYLCEENVANFSDAVFRLLETGEPSFYRILVDMPKNLPDSLTMTPLTSGKLCLGYGLTWFIAASLVEPSAVPYSPKSRKRISKVIMSFFKTTLHSPVNFTKEPLLVRSSSRGLLESSPKLMVCGKLDKQTYILGNDQVMNLMLEFAGPTGNIKSIRVNCKQLVSIHLANYQGPIKIKNTWLKKEHLATNLIEIPLTDLQQQIYNAGGCYQLGLYSRPKGELKWDLAQSSLNFLKASSSVASILIEYYMNVHIVLGWTRRNLVLRIPFDLVYSCKNIPNGSSDEALSLSQKLVPGNPPTLFLPPESEFPALNWEEDMEDAKILYKTSISGIEELQLASRTCIRPNADKFVTHLKELTLHLSKLKSHLIRFLQQPPQSTAARDLVKSVRSALEAHALAVFYSEIERDQRQVLLRNGYEFFNDLECILFGLTEDDCEDFGGSGDDDCGLFYDNDLPLRASARIQGRFISILELYPPLQDLVKFLVSDEVGYYSQNPLLLESGFNRFYIREYLEFNGWSLGFLPPSSLPTELKLALIDKSPEQRLECLASVVYE